MPPQVSPVRTFVTLLALIFGIELFMMLALHYVFPEDLPLLTEALIDATLLTAILAFFMWRLIVSPLRLAMASEAARAKAIMDTAADGIVTTDERGTIESFNRAAERMFGYDPHSVIGRNVSILMPRSHASKHDGYIARYLRTGQARIMGRAVELTGQRKDGSEFPIELNLTEVHVGGKRYFTGILRDISERKEAEERIHTLAHSDSLTGLPNRALFYDRLGQAIGFANRAHHELALLFIDLDHFKNVNDTLGHNAGDELLQTVGGRLLRLVRKSDTVARIGGDEFVIILPRIESRKDASEVARKVIEALAAPFFIGTPPNAASIGASVGIALYPAHAANIEALIKAADRAMYHAKKTRNAFHFYDKEPETARRSAADLTE